MKIRPQILQTCTFISICIFAAGSTFSIAVTQTALFLAAVFWVWKMVLEKKSSIPKTGLERYFLIYIILGAISMLFAAEGGMLYIFVKRVLLIPIVYIIAGNMTDRKWLRIMLFSLIGAMVILSILGIHKYLTGVGGLEGRLKLFHHYMTSGGILMIISLLTFGFVIVKTPVRLRLAAFACGSLMLFPLIFTFTRSSWLGFVCGMSLMAVLHSKKWLIVIVSAVMLIGIFAPYSLKKRALSAFDPTHPNNVERTYMWIAGLEMMKDRPLTGMGDVDLKQIYDRYKSPLAKQRNGHLHNNFIMFGATLGVPGFILFFALFIHIFIIGFRNYRKVPEHDRLMKGVALGCLGILAAFHVNGLFEWNFGDAEIAMLLWTTVGLLLVAGSAVESSGVPVDDQTV